jgi:hypothetical protein
VIAAIDDPAVANAILAHLGMPTEIPTTARARDPTDDERDASSVDLE